MTNYSFKRNPINVKFFDLNSNNTFNQYDYFFNQDHEKKEKVFPPWLRLPSHYVGDVWQKTIDVRDKLLTLHNTFVFKLECSHTVEIDRTSILMERQVRMIYVNCEKCGGTGEVRIV